MKTGIYILPYLLLCIATGICGQRTAGYSMFENMLLSREALTARCFQQDRDGMMWIGSDKGLFSYDGYSSHAHFSYGDSHSLPVNCAILYGDDRLLLGTQKGILMYNCKSDEYEPFPLKFTGEVQSLAIAGGELWIGSMIGLFRYDMKSGILERIKMSKDPARHTEMVYSIIEYGGDIYAGSHIGFGRYLPEKGEFEFIIPEDAFGSGRFFVNSLLKDVKRKCIWVGTGNSLLKYSPENNTVEHKMPCSFVKVICLDDSDNLVIGTDNGLFIYDGTDAVYVKHNSQDSKSLANNIVWTVYSDASHNLWIGTDYGISMLSGDSNLEYIPVHRLTGLVDGNCLYSIYRDSSSYWLGGTNGLIRTSDPASGRTSQWYMVNGQDAPITHNHIRYVYGDGKNSLLVATDGGINRYDYGTGRFSLCHIMDSTGVYNSSWTYNILDDKKGNLWIATCMSGILVIEKDSLKGSCVADKCFTTDNGLAGNFVSHIAIDHDDNIWALVYKTGIDMIDTRTDSIEHIPLLQQTDNAPPSLILCDSDGNIWVAFCRGAVRIDARTRQMQTIYFSRNPVEPLAMIEVEGKIWISSSDGIWLIDRKGLTTQHQNLMNRIFTGLYYDRETELVYLGTNDGLAVVNPNTVCPSVGSPILITALHINGETASMKSFGGKSIRYLDNITLSYNRNTFSMEFSDLNFSQEHRSTFIYKLKQKDDTWHMLKAGENSISFSSLEPGKYTLLVSRQGINGQPGNVIKTFEIRIRPPWYSAPLAKCIYGILLAVMIAWTLYFFKIKSRLRLERMEREQTQKQTELKLDFFTEISHEFKTPLSLIIAPLSCMIIEQRNTEARRKLELVYQNAMKLNSLVHQAIDFYRYDSDNLSLIRSQIEFVEFARTIFSTYSDNMNEKKRTFIFNSSLSRIYLCADVIKMESVLNNLLNNACKYTGEDDNIMLSIDYMQEGRILEIKVSDTGIGIPEQDRPFVFQRFFQSPVNSRNREGTGIGLYMVKQFVELHGGTIHVASEEGSGTSLTVRLPVELSDNMEQTRSCSSEPLMNEDANKPLIVIVEDNADMAAFICNMLEKDYRCVTAYNGKVGLKLATELMPDLIIADVMMPVMDGIEMCRRLKGNVPTSTIPLILLTAKDDKTTELSSIQFNIDIFISKPFDPAILHSRAKQLIDRKRQMEKKVRIEILTEPKIEPVISYDEKLLAKLTAIIEENIADPNFNVNSLCEKTGIGQKQLYRKMKQLTGMSTIEYINSIKLKKAALLLTGKKYTVSEVMYMVGFSNNSYFAKCFFAQFGKTPNQYQSDNR